MESEQILLYHHYALSFVVTRGSVPIYWSQPGYKYRPPPKLDRNQEEDKDAFQKHLAKEFELYGSPITAINLAERLGREKVISEAFLKQALGLNDDRLCFVSFDFHEHCKGMRFENVNILLQSIKDRVRALRYCWMDKRGVVCRQEGVFRINCIDCLDRTNVVQTAISRMMLESQLTKLGVILPDQPLPLVTRMAFQG